MEGTGDHHVEQNKQDAENHVSHFSFTFEI
jgi:hypothetical protein